ncbi:glycohydrolase toxin TNT-related protein [Pseudarthrobacter sp. PvP090]|uniref:glycohydrolase toxin TNT-related protein n=1 Tax=Pseudarthrobacter sp. PvP090 TaxID=3156393 RepID=UPI003396BE34
MFDVYPPNDGAVRGSRLEFKNLGEFRAHGAVLDRVGGEDGSHLYLLIDGKPASFEARSLPVNALELPYSKYHVAEDWPVGAEGWTVEGSVVGPGFGRDGGASQVLFRDAGGTVLTVEELLKAGVLSN